MSAGRRLIMSAIALALLYGNAMVALQPPELVRLGLYIPHPAFVRNAFELTSMFSSNAPYNEDYVIYALRTQTGRAEDRGQWIRLPLTEHFPRRHSVTTMQLYVLFPTRVYGEAGARRAWTMLAGKIRANHNRRHPDFPVAQIRVDRVQWPPDPRGFRAGEVPGKTQEYMLFGEALE